MENQHTEHHHDDFTATYSAEDNKLRLYAVYRLDDEDYQRVKAAGFKWAPKQELFVAPSWTPRREDLCMAFAGEIEAEEMTLAERAAMKAERLDGYAVKRSRDANAYQQAAHRIGERFAGGQPILIGHHSERKARRDQEKMHHAMDKAVQADKLADYWTYRAEGVEAHANYKNKPAVRARRIKTLLAELRDFQRRVNHHHKAVKLWQQIQQQQDEEKRHKAVAYYCGAYTKEGSYGYEGAWSALDKGEIGADDVLEKALQAHQNSLNSDYYPRWIEHTLNRLGYETALLGSVPLFEGELTAVLLQGFTRTHGTDKPKASQDGESWTVTSLVALPLHLTGGEECESLTLTADQWRGLMQQCGYDVIASQPRKPRRTARSASPLLNIDTDVLHSPHCWNGSLRAFEVVRMTKADYKKVIPDNRRTEAAEGKQYRFRTVWISGTGGTFTGGAWKAVFLTDSKAHPMPEAPATPETTTAE